MERGKKKSTVTGVRKKLIPTLTGDFEKLKTSVQEVNCRCGGNN